MSALKNLILTCFLAIASSLIASAQVNITMWGVDHAHSWVNNQETILTPSNVSPATFGPLFTQPLDGEVYGQVLYASNLTINGATHNVVFVGTQHCGVYAFDADNNAGPNASPLWYDSLIPAANTNGTYNVSNPPVSQVSEPIPFFAVGTTAVPFNTISQPDIDVEMGMTASMVIDTATKTLYAITKIQTTAQRTDSTGTYTPGTFQQYLHAIDMTTGAEKPNSPVLINVSFAGIANHTEKINDINYYEQSASTDPTVTGVVPFNPLHEHARAGLTEYNNTIFITYASHTDARPYHGEILGYDATTLQLKNWFISTPNGDAGGIWSGGASPAIDTLDANNLGKMFVITGNGDWDQASGAPYTTNTDFGESFIKLPTNATGQYSASAADATTFFTPGIWHDLNNGDADLGASGTSLLPPLTGAHTNIMVGGGKGSILYVVDRDFLGGEQGTDADIQEISEQGGHNIFAAPAYFVPAGSPNGYIYYAPGGGALEQRAVGQNISGPNTYISDPPTHQSTDTYPVKGANVFITANNNSNGLVWAVNGSLRVHNASDVSGNPIYTYNVPNSTVKFSAPTVANGKAYITNFKSTADRTTNVAGSCNLIVLGLLQQFTEVPSPAPTGLTATTTSSNSIRLNWTNTATDLSGFHVWRNTAATGTFADITPSGVAANVTTYTDTGLTPNTTYYYYVTSYNNVGDSSPTSTVSAKTLTLFTAPGLVGYWPLDENTGGDGDPTNDVTGNGHVGTLQGEFNWTAGEVNFAINFHGTNNAAHVDVPDAATLRFTASQSFTVGAWVFPVTVTSGKEQTLVNKSADQGNEYGLYINAAGNWVFRTGSSSNPTANDIVGPPAVANSWTYISGVQDATTGVRTLYINGAAVATGTAQPGDGAGHLYIGAQNVAAPADNAFQGKIDEVRVYNIAIPANQMTDLMAPPILQGVSNQIHGGAGTFGLQLTPSATIATEARKGSTAGSYSLVLTFSAPVSGISASLQLQSGGAAVGNVGTITYDSSGAIVTVPLTGVADAQALNLHLTGIQPGNATANIPFNVLWGDVNQNNYVDYLDTILSTKIQGTGISSANFVYDVNCDGTLNAADTTIVNSVAGTSAGTQLATNLAAFQPASDTTNNGGGTNASAAVDNNLGTRWESIHAAGIQWVEVDLGSVSTISTINLNWENAGAAEFELQWSNTNNGTDWTDFVNPANSQSWHVTGNTTPNGANPETFPVISQQARYVRVLCEVRDTNFGYSLWDFQVLGIPGSHTANPIPSLTGDLIDTGAVGTALPAFTITASNSPTNFTATGLPPGLSIDSGGDITGTPTAGGTFTAFVTATNNSGNSAATPVVFTISGGTGGSAPVVSATPAPSAGTVGTAYSYQVTASNTPTGYAVSTGTLPAGLNLNATSGLISGTPTTAGTSTFSVTATNGSGTSPAVSFSITINTGGGGGGSAPVVSANPAPSAGTIGAAYNYQVAASNTPTSYAVSTGTLPAGLSLNATSGLISGTPTTAGTSAFSITATNGSGTSPAVSFSITIGGVANTPVISTTTPAAGLQNGYYTYQLGASNNPTTYAVTTGTLPAGLSLNAGNGLISGTPTGSGSSTVGITATNTNGAGPEASMTVTVTANSDTNLARNVGVTATSSNPGTDISSAAQAIDGNFGSRWETVHDTPADPSTITVDLQQSYAIDAIDIDWENASAATYTISVSQTGLAGSWTRVGPTDSFVNPGGGGINLWTGIGQTARFVQLTGLTRTTPYGYSIWELQIFGHAAGGSAPVVSATPAPSAGTVGTAYSYQVSASNTPTGYAVSTGTLPAGLSLNATSGLISGTPITAGTSTFSITATNGSGTSPAVNFSITINAAGGSAPVVSATPAPSAGTVGTAYNYQVTASNTPTGYAVSAGTLPASLSLNATSGLISGTPTTAGTSIFSVTATNGSGTSPAVSFSITIGAANTPVISTTTPTTGLQNGYYTYQLVASNNPGSYAVTTGTLPAGLSLNAGNGWVTGTPTSSGSFTVGITATNANGAGPEASMTFSITANTDTNLARNAGVTATSSNPGTDISSASQAIDGDFGTRWETVHDTPADPSTITVDLQQSYAIDAIDIDWENASAATYTISVSQTGLAGSWTRVGPSDSFVNPGGGGVNLWTGIGQTARFVQLTGLTRTTPYGYSIWELQIFGHTGSGGGGSAPVVSATPAPSAGTVGTAYSYQVSATNTPTGYALSTGVLPAGLSLNATSGLISGTPSAAGTSTFSVTATNGSGTSPAVSFGITVNTAGGGAPSIVSLGTATGTVGTALNYAISATNTPTSYALPSGALPAGVSLNTTTGIISGTPTTAGTTTANITATNGSGVSATFNLAITIYAANVAPTITSATSTAATVGSVFSYQIAASDAPTGYAMPTGTLPAGLTFNATTGTITGTPTTAGTSSVTLTASNSHGASTAITLAITVNATSSDTNVGLNKTAGASTVQGGNEIASANDGNTGTRWAASSGVVPQYWKVNLGASKTLSRIDVNWFTNATRYTQYTILTSSDGINWTTQINKTANVTTGTTSDTFAAPVTAQYVLVNASFTSAGFVSINEIGVYGH